MEDFDTLDPVIKALVARKAYLAACLIELQAKAKRAAQLVDNVQNELIQIENYLNYLHPSVTYPPIPEEEGTGN